MKEEEILFFPGDAYVLQQNNYYGHVLILSVRRLEGMCIPGIVTITYLFTRFSKLLMRDMHVTVETSTHDLMDNKGMWLSERNNWTPLK